MAYKPPNNDPAASIFDMAGRPAPVRGIITGIIAAVVALLLFIGAFSSFFTVQPEERAVVTRLGKIHAVAEPGLNFKIPFGIDRAYIVPTEQIQKLEFGFRESSVGEQTTYSDRDYSGESLMLTGDLNIINVEWVVQYQIRDPEKYLFRGPRNPEQALRDMSEAVMRRIIGNRLGSNALTVGREEIADAAQVEIQEIMDSFESGIAVLRVELQDVKPPREVQASFNEVNQARQERERLINEAERQRNEIIPRAQGQARQMLTEAEGYAIERVNRAKGEGVRFLSILEEYRNAPDVTRRRLYLEMLDEVLPTVERVYVLGGDNASAPLPLLSLDAPTTPARRGAAQEAAR
jgi:membrane protease subunit HflK